MLFTLFSNFGDKSFALTSIISPSQVGLMQSIISHGAASPFFSEKHSAHLSAFINAILSAVTQGDTTV